MRIITVKEALTRVGEQITGIHGTLTAVYKRRTGDGQYGPYSFQDGLLKDDTGTITVTFGNQEDLTKRKGMKCTITGKEGKKGIEGLLVVEEEYKDKKTIKIKTSVSAFLDFGTTPASDGPTTATAAQPELPSGEPTDEEEAALLAALEAARKKKAERLEAEAKAKALEASADKAAPVNVLDYASAKRRIIQISNLYGYALRSAKHALGQQGLEIKDLTTSAATLFISMKEDGLVSAMPQTLIEEKPSSAFIAAALQPPRDPAVQPEPPEETFDQEPTTWQEVVYNGTKLGETDPQMLELLFNTFKPKTDPATGNYSMKDLYLKNALLTWRKETM